MLCTVAKVCRGKIGEVVVKVHGRPCFITLRNVILPDSDWSDVSVGSVYEMGGVAGWNISTSSFDECRLSQSTARGDFVFESLSTNSAPKTRPKWQTMVE
jgi:hypothetical protein